MLDLLYVFTTFVIGLFAGALFTEGCVLVPYWRKMPPSEFFRLHGSMGPSLFRYFAPLTTIAVGLSIASAIASIWKAMGADGLNIWRIAAAALCACALLIFFLYFKKANGKFANHTLADNELGGELRRWAAWHWTRTILVMTALFSSILAMMR